MLRKNRLFTPGPTPLLPAAQMAMASADFHHRTAEFRELYKRTLADLKTFIGTKNDVLLLAASGTGAMEASVSNLTSPGDKVLVLTAGKFGERWVSLAKAFGCTIETVTAPYGETFDLEQVKAKLEDVRIVYMQATETSTGARHDVKAIANLVKANDALLVVDGITGLGTTHLDVDGWGVDVIIGGSQKAVMAPPGLAYLSVSEKAWERMVRAKQPRYYFDLYKERKSAANGESAYTPATSLIAALAAAMDYIRAMGKGDLAAGRESLIDNAETVAAMTREAVQALGLKLFAPTCPAAAVTAVQTPEGLDSGAIVKEFRERFASVLANGQGEMKGKLFRVAHLGYFDYLDTIGMIGALEHVLAKVQKPKHIEFGTGLKAAQLAYLRCTAELLEKAKA
jgi:aspartate aminotransferase-like enzyme